jgi:hypothetical protein
MSECPNCERQKQRVELWRQEAYRLSERQWVGLTDGELMECTVFKTFTYDSPCTDNNGAKHVGGIEVSLRATYENVNNKLKEKNT